MLEVLVITISNPLLIGIYKNKELIKEYKCEGKTSDLLPSLFEKILNEYKIEKINYVNTPGSFMSIKVAYVFLKTLSIVNKIPLMSCEGFLFNQNSPIKALGKKYFIKRGNKISIEFLSDNDEIKDFSLPEKIDKIKFEEKNLPIYNLPAV